MFKIALDLAQTDPAHVMYIDDRAMFVEVARTQGIRGIWHQNPTQTQRELQGAGLTVD